ncbi:hypothetical protein EJ04DRAFT_562072 [Polyplosphaeria fusca]|uniref:Uncharacterized protein n=1 Tax=Polyplosphaeria fusca TaxID=682080 RepID=A0A9P4V510_9PLEO|nr:hypothetical protein EJ04DRAFT_562072 [Polyplosphaeria fusca]
MNDYLHERYRVSRSSSVISDSSDGRHTPVAIQQPVSPLDQEAPPFSQRVSEEKNRKIPGSPAGPNILHRGGWISALSCTGDIIVVMTSIVFLVYASFVIHNDGVPVTEVPNLPTLKDAARYGPTIFPILFAAIVGQAMHAIAHWRLENGERMKVLDQLLGSTGLFSTVITQFKFRNMGFTGAGLVILWLLSPLGGQASLRVLDFGSETLTQSHNIYYLDRRSEYQPAQQTMQGLDISESVWVGSQLYMASVAGTRAVKESGMDIWGNLKIPMLERLDTVQEPDGWHKIDHTKNVTYSSLIGVPLSLLSQSANTTFNLEYPYWTLDCPVRQKANFSDPRQTWLLPGENVTAISGADDGWEVGTSGTWGISTLSAGFQENDKNLTNRVFYYKGYDDDSGKTMSASKAQCSMSTTYVEVSAICIARNCTVDRMRPSTQPHPPSAWALGIEPTTHLFFYDFHKAAALETFRTPTPIQRYFRNPIAVGLLTSGIPPESAIGKESLTYNLSFDRAYYLRSNATETRVVATVKCQRGWLAALYIATAAMLLAGVFGLVLEFSRKAPGFALNISSLTRDNPYIVLPRGGSTLDSIDRSRLLQDVRVRLGDVKPGDPVGYIAIASCDEKGRVVRLSGLERSRTFE